MKGPVVRVGTRRSSLARAQTATLVSALEARFPGLQAVPVLITTAGDRTRATSGPLDFTDAIDSAVLSGIVDVGVHSAKDLPSAMRRSIRIGAIPLREDPRDCLVLRTPGSLKGLAAGSRIGSSSLRRQAQLRRARPDLEIVELRGNVDTRISRVREGTLDGALLAVAGMRRLGRESEIDEVLPPASFLPAPGQGALAVTARKGDRRMARLLNALDHPASRQAVIAERAFSTALGGDCRVPLAALGRVRGGFLTLRAEVLDPLGDRHWSGRVVGSAVGSAQLGRRLAREAMGAGVGEWMTGGVRA